MSMEKCKSCKIKYPEEILYFGECGVCGLKRTNKELGIKRDKFQGEIAESFRLEALKIRKLIIK